MAHDYWNDLYSGWGWFLWFGIVFLFAASLGNWGYTYRAHRKYEDVYPRRDPLNLLNERYARGDIEREEYLRMRADISGDTVGTLKKSA
jgi:putative membrane protein